MEHLYRMNILNKIKEIRTNNNILWMEILRLALESNPKETKKILKGIFKNDRTINTNLKKLIR